jgi:hypothetical protein
MVAAHYPPSGESGSRRPHHVVQALLQAGHRVTVLVCGGETPRIEQRASGEEIQWLGTRLAQSRLGRRLEWARRIMPWTQDGHDGYARAVRSAIAGLAPTEPLLVYVSAPPASLAMMAAAAASARSAPTALILEFRDPWRLRTYSPMVRLQERVLRRYRDATTRRATALVAVTDSVGDHLRQIAPAIRCVVARNGIPDDLLLAGHEAAVGGELAMLHLGEFYLERDPMPVLASLARLRAGEASDADRVRLDFVGEVESTPSGPTRTVLGRLGLTAIARLSPRVPHERAIEHLEAASIYLLMAQHQPLQIPNKLYEYLGYRRPILSVVDRGGETERILLAAGHGETLLHPDATPEQVDTALGRALAIASAGTPVGDDATLRELSTSRQLHSVVRLVEELGIAMTGPTA